jgi:uncharacterized membrane protein YedE/YeeE
MPPTEFTPLPALLGGALIGLSAVMLLALNGRIAGISGIASRLLPPFGGDLAGRAAFVVGLIAAPAVYLLAGAGPVEQVMPANVALLAAAGLLVGFGAVWGSGCTSGHGVCGLSRLSPRSMVATGVFMATAVATVFVVRHVIGG